VKPFFDFFTDRRSPSGLTSYCKPCMTRRNAESKARRARGERVEKRRPPRLLLDWSDEKVCPGCGLTKPLEDFAINRTRRRDIGTYCLPCHNRVVRENLEKNHGSTRNFHLKRRYGITEDEVAVMIEAQGGLCAICGTRPAEHVDHDHSTGAVRGILCFTCNVGLGNFDEDTDRMRLAIDYVERHSPDEEGREFVRRRMERLFGRAS
jgi:hypothetical protein